MSACKAKGSAPPSVHELRSRFTNATAIEVLTFILSDLQGSRAAVVSSFGAEAPVLLHMVSQIDRDTPILFINTNRHFPETLFYRDQLSAHLGLRQVLDIGPSASAEAKHDPHNSLARTDPDSCCSFRKTEPLRRALDDFDIWISGRKRYQAGTRHNLQIFETDDRWLKVNPLAHWSAEAIGTYLVHHHLPVHPLVDRGYPSIGCEPCTSVVRFGEDARAGRWRGIDKTECGIHLPRGPVAT